MSLSSTDFIVNKKQLNETKFVETEIPSADDLAPGQAILKIDQSCLRLFDVHDELEGWQLKGFDGLPRDREGDPCRQHAEPCDYLISFLS